VTQESSEQLRAQDVKIAPRIPSRQRGADRSAQNVHPTPPLRESKELTTRICVSTSVHQASLVRRTAQAVSCAQTTHTRPCQDDRLVMPVLKVMRLKETREGTASKTASRCVESVRPPLMRA